MESHPAAVEGVLAQSGSASHVIFASGGVDHFQSLVAHRPVHAEVWRLPGLPGFCIANSWNTGRKLLCEEKHDVSKRPQRSTHSSLVLGGKHEGNYPHNQDIYEKPFHLAKQRKTRPSSWGTLGTELTLFHIIRGPWPPLYLKHKWQIYGGHKSLRLWTELLGSIWQHSSPKMIYRGWNPRSSEAAALHG